MNFRCGKSDIQPSYWVYWVFTGVLARSVPRCVLWRVGELENQRVGEIMGFGEKNYPGQLLLQFSPQRKTGLLMENGDFIVGKW